MLDLLAQFTVSSTSPTRHASFLRANLLYDGTLITPGHIPYFDCRSGVLADDTARRDGESGARQCLWVLTHDLIRSTPNAAEQCYVRSGEDDVDRLWGVCPR